MSKEPIVFHRTTRLPRLLVSDLDGTLLTPRHTVSRRTTEALAAVQAAGVRVMLASGRAPRSVQKVVAQLGGALVPDAVLCCNGAVTLALPTRALADPARLPLAPALRIIDALRCAVAAPGFACELVYESDASDTFFVCDRAWEAERKHSIYYPYTPVDDLSVFLESLQNGAAIKLMALDRTKPASELYESLPASLKDEKETSLSLVYSGPYFLEISASGVNKGFGLEKYCLANGIDRKDVVAFGDLLNDAEMLQYAGLGLCMGNGHPDMKAIADRVIGTNAEDGVAREIESWLDLVPSEAALANPTFLTPSVDE